MSLEREQLKTAKLRAKLRAIQERIGRKEDKLSDAQDRLASAISKGKRYVAKHEAKVTAGMAIQKVGRGTDEYERDDQGRFA